MIVAIGVKDIAIKRLKVAKAPSVIFRKPALLFSTDQPSIPLGFMASLAPMACVAASLTTSANAVLKPSIIRSLLIP
jgi:hypothetical protein